MPDVQKELVQIVAVILFAAPAVSGSHPTAVVRTEQATMETERSLTHTEQVRHLSD